MKFLILICFIFISTLCFAQKRNVYFLKNDGRLVASKDSADFIRIVSEPDSGSILYNLNEYYLSGKPKRIGKLYAINENSFEGAVISYYESGKRQQIANYEKGHLTGDIYDYYPNGKVYTIKTLVKGEFLVKTCNDTTGKSLATEGNGYYIIYKNDFNSVIEEGQIRFGLKDGEWKGSMQKDSILTFNENYNKGKLLIGVSKDFAGDTFNYKKREISPEFKTNFGDFLSKNIKYPSEAKSKHIEGRVFIEFTVDKSGKVSDLKILRALSADLVEESIRLINLSSSYWIPGYNFGKPKSTRLAAAINFKIDGNAEQIIPAALSDKN